MPSKVEPFEEKIVGTNQHSVWSRCPDCLTWGIAMPLNKICGNCNARNVITYYDCHTIQAFLDQPDAGKEE